MSSKWYDLEQYRRQELDYCLKLAAGHTEQTSEFYARYGLALSYHQMYLDAVKLVAECKGTPQFRGVTDLIDSMANGTLPSSELEFPATIEPVAHDAIQCYLHRKALQMHKSYKRLPVKHAKTIVGDLSVLEGLYTETDDGYLEALPHTEHLYTPNTTREINILSETSEEIQESTRDQRSVPHTRIIRRPDQMEVE